MSRRQTRRSTDEIDAAPAVPATPEQLEHAAREMCLRMLTLQPRTRKELADGLRRRGIPDEIAEGVLTRFSDVGLVDDAAFAKAWVTSRHRGRGLARKALAHELHRRGVDRESVTAAVEQIDASDELVAARELVRRKLAGMQQVAPQARTRRLLGMLARRGYGAGIAMQAIREMESDLAAEALVDVVEDDVDDLEGSGRDAV